MARQPRIEYPGAIYHVMARGDRRGRVVHDENDRYSLIETLGNRNTTVSQGWISERLRMKVRRMSEQLRQHVAFPGYRREIVCEDWEREHLNELRERL